MILRVLQLAARLLIGGVFIVAAAPKIANPEAFAEAIFRYQIVPHSLINVVAIGLPWLELVIGCLVMVSPRYRDAAALWIVLLLVAFTISIAFNIHRGIDVACGCFTTDPQASRIGWWKVAENIGLILAALLVFVQSLRRQAT
jgi:uncharacterized membrane protein YphA (DoxX/SURF4 family)